MTAASGGVIFCASIPDRRNGDARTPKGEGAAALSYGVKPNQQTKARWTTLAVNTIKSVFIERRITGAPFIHGGSIEARRPAMD